MARMLAAILLILTLTLTLGASPCASQPGFQSINCGGEAYKDPNTNITWDADPFNHSSNVFSYGKVGKVNSSTHVMTTLRFFPNDSRNKKFCYSFGKVINGRRYLLRASFLYGNYDGLNQPPTFVLILNFDAWTNVTTSASTIPVVHELIFVSNEDVLNICLAPNLISNHTPFISTLELRILETSMYNFTEGALSQGYGIMLWRRINYGAITQVEIRYPDDRFDRIWEANTTGPIVSTSINNVAVYDVIDLEMPPAAVMATAITTNSPTGNLTFTYDGVGGYGGFVVEMHFEEVDEKARGQSSLRSVGLEVAGETLTQFEISSVGPNIASMDEQGEFPFPLQFTLFPLAASPLGPLLNAIELFRWTSQPLSTSGTFPGDVEAIQEVQANFNLMGYGEGDPCMPEGYTWTWIECSHSRIIKINLASFKIIGKISPFINNLTSLQRVDLSNNMLSGEIPDMSLLSHLVYLDLHNNYLSGELSPSLLSLNKLSKLDVSNNNLCGSPPSFPQSTNYTQIGNTRLCDGCNCGSIPPSYNTRKYIFALSFLGTISIVSILSVILLVLEKATRHMRAKEALGMRAKEALGISTIKRGVDDLKGPTFMSKLFTYHDIKRATLNFTTLLGEGGFGKVYHGLLPTGEEIAVKMLADISKQGLKQFYNEVSILSGVRHKNVVSLIGYCVEKKYMLIYEYIAKGNLRELIYGDVDSTDKTLPWTTRLHIAYDASQGLDYLHKGCDPTIIHRDVKSSNILLSEKMQAKVSDFGLSRLKEGDSAISHVSTIHVVGTPGYLDPMYHSTNQLTDKSDVYSFGIVLFELICGRGPIDISVSPPNIVDWAKHAIEQGKFEDIVDPTLANGYKVESMQKVIDVAFECVEFDRIKRPKMNEVSHLLQNALNVEMNHFNSQDVSGSSYASGGKSPKLQSIQINVEPR